MKWPGERWTESGAESALPIMFQFSSQLVLLQEKSQVLCLFSSGHLLPFCSDLSSCPIPPLWVGREDDLGLPFVQAQCCL